jgi:transcriptional regulator with XRE-family HTH domain
MGLFISLILRAEPTVKTFNAISGTKMLTSDQIRAARALVRWSAEDLAKESGVGLSTIRRIEGAQGVPSASAKNLALIQEALERAGVQFVEGNGGGPGVRLRAR